MKTISLLFVFLCSSSLVGMDKQEEAIRKQETKQEESTTQKAQKPRIIRYDCGNQVILAPENANQETLALAMRLAMMHRDHPYNPAKKQNN